MVGVKLVREDAFARIQLDRPDKVNALSPQLLDELVKICDELRDDNTVRVVLLEGVGASFSTGADLPAFSRELETSPEKTADLGRVASDALANLPQITIAALHGHCIGGALVLASVCDLRIAADDCRFWIPELMAGIPLGWGGMAYLVQMVGQAMAADIVLSCRPFGPDDALRTGFVSRVIPKTDLERETAALIETIAAKASLPLRATKDQLKAIRRGTFDPRKDAEALLRAVADPESGAVFKEYVRRLT